MRRWSQLGRGVDMNLQASQSCRTPNWPLIDTRLNMHTTLLHDICSHIVSKVLRTALFGCGCVGIGDRGWIFGHKPHLSGRYMYVAPEMRQARGRVRRGSDRCDKGHLSLDP